MEHGQDHYEVGVHVQAQQAVEADYKEGTEEPHAQSKHYSQLTKVGASTICERRGDKIGNPI